MDRTSKKAFEITKNVTESNADTLANVRSGGRIEQLQRQLTNKDREIGRLRNALQYLYKIDMKKCTGYKYTVAEVTKIYRHTKQILKGK